MVFHLQPMMSKTLASHVFETVKIIGDCCTSFLCGLLWWLWNTPKVLLAIYIVLHFLSIILWCLWMCGYNIFPWVTDDEPVGMEANVAIERNDEDDIVSKLELGTITLTPTGKKFHPWRACGSLRKSWRLNKYEMCAHCKHHINEAFKKLS